MPPKDGLAARTAKAAARGRSPHAAALSGKVEAQLMKSWARTVLRPFALARFAACPSSQYMYSFRAVNASPAELQSVFFSTSLALLAHTSDSNALVVCFDHRLEG